MAKILIIAADGEQRTRLGLDCLRQGHVITVAANLTQAQAWVAADAPDLLIAVSDAAPPPATGAPEAE